MRQNHLVLSAVFGAPGLVVAGGTGNGRPLWSWPLSARRPSGLCSEEEQPEAGTSLVQGIYQLSKLHEEPHELEVSQPDAWRPPLPGELHGHPSRIKGAHSELQDPWPADRRRAQQAAALQAFNTTQRLLPAVRSLFLSSFLQDGASYLPHSKSRTSMALGGIMLLVPLVFCAAALAAAFGPEAPALSPVADVHTPAPTSAPVLQGRAALAPTLSLRSVAQIPHTKFQQLSQGTQIGFLAVPSDLCPELVVPEGSVCSLFVPLEFPHDGTDSNTIVIKDVCGEPIFRASFTFDTSESGKLVVSGIVLRGAPSEAVFASCHYDEGCGSPGFTICHHSGRTYAKLRADGPDTPDYFTVLIFNQGSRMSFRFDPQGCSLHAYDEHGKLLTIAETHGTRRSVRVGPLVD
eukprot:CAMPEP_0179177342 /NCGR_PEP_ID=MMETSP0796-20121207/87700_1 /TAXON_ID=73915 /ORGANISM="Pyrodinium bahamense, Strain pbaha01" /LENGTH=404 /DNA_ID=CAMNT_0020880889 /DNA_START=16 /DNA_END=1228 /DNA_ORIENTATION=-